MAGSGFVDGGVGGDDAVDFGLYGGVGNVGHLLLVEIQGVSAASGTQRPWAAARCACLFSGRSGVRSILIAALQRALKFWVLGEEIFTVCQSPRRSTEYLRYKCSNILTA